MSVTRTPLNHALAEVIAGMIQAIRMGESAKARQVGLTALAVYAHDAGDDITVDTLLASADVPEVPVPEALRSRVPMMRLHNPADVRPEMFLEEDAEID